MSTSRVSRLVQAPREAVYRACSEPQELVRWRMPRDMNAQLLGVDGVRYRMSLTYPDGRADTFEATFAERVPNERIVERIHFDAAERAGEITMTTLLHAAEGGTEVTVLTENLPAAIRLEDNDEGTRQALARLAELVEVRATIDRRLADIERQFGVEIFYACESGSRAWDFASPDSDYDVRFLYRHPRDWYLSLSEQRDVIETPIEGVYDVNGWDLRKGLRLARKGNPVLFEWLSSPIRYIDTPLGVDFRKAVNAAFDPTTAYRHYYNMALKQWRAYFGRELVRHKKYFYVVRPLLACSYLRYRPRIVPMRFEELAASVRIPANIREVLARLLETKRRSSEAAEAPPIPELHAWIEKALGKLTHGAPPSTKAPDLSRLDAFFQQTLDSPRRLT